MCSITADISPDLGGGGIGVGGFTPNSEVRFEIFQSPGGALLFGPVTKPTDATGSEALSFDALAAGHHVVVTDLATSTVKDIVVSDATVDEVDVATDLVSGTAAPGTNVTVMVFGYGSSLSSPSAAPVADELGNWSADFAALSVDVTNRTGITAIVNDGDGDATRTGPRPGCPAVHPSQTCRLDVTSDGGGGDQITIIGFSPLSDVRIEVFDSVGGELVYGPLLRQTGSTGFQGHHSAFDLTGGDHIVVTDLASGMVKDLEVAALALTAVDTVADTVSGTADPGTEVFVGLFGTPAVLAVADDQGQWVAQFSGDPSQGQDVMDQSNPNAMVFDEDEDATRAAPAPGCSGIGFVCIVGSNLEHDSVQVFGFEPNSEVIFEIFDAAGTPAIDPATRPTNAEGSASLDFGFNPGPDLLPGMDVRVTDVTSGVVKTLVLSDLSIDLVDPATDVVEGHAPAGKLVGVEAVGAPRALDVMADDSGFWRADFGVLGYDIDAVSWFLAGVADEDVDFTNDSLGSPIPGCVDDADTACGSAAPDTIREDDGEVITGLESDTALITLGEGSIGVEVEGGAGADDTVIDPGESRAASHGAFASLLVDDLLSIRVDGGRGSDRVVLPTAAADLLIVVFGGGGDDVVRLRDFGELLATVGHFELSGGPGRDDLSGADGSDLLHGDIGDDLMQGLAALDRLVGGPGDDKLLGGSGADVLIGGDGFDVMKGGPGRDTCIFDTRREKRRARSCEVLRRLG